MRILTLLLISLAAVAVLLAGVWLVSQNQLDDGGANSGTPAANAEAFDATPDAPATGAAPRPAT